MSRRLVLRFGQVFILAAVTAAQVPLPRRGDPEPPKLRPADGSATALNPPSFLWPPDPDAVSYEVQWAGHPAFAQARTAEAPWNTYTHDAALAPGEYFWRYRLKTRNGTPSAWSRAHRFTIPRTATVQPIPSAAELRQRIPEAHPRVMLRPEALPRLRKLAAGDYARIFAGVREAADRLVQKAPPGEPNADWNGFMTAQRAMNAAQVLAFTYLITQDPLYGSAARRWVLAAAEWDAGGKTSKRANDYAWAQVARACVAYDWAYQALSPEDRAAVRGALAKRAALLWWKKGAEGTGAGEIRMSAESHDEMHYPYLGQCAMALYGEVPEAEPALNYVVNRFQSVYPAWGDDDGGWHEGFHYWCVLMASLSQSGWAQTERDVLGIDPFKKPYFRRAMDYAIYNLPPGAPDAGFGDMSDVPGIADEARGRMFLDYLVRGNAGLPGSHSAYWQWWIDTWGWDLVAGKAGTRDESSIAAAQMLDFLYRATMPPQPAPKPPSDLPQSKLFRGTGVASLHTNLRDSASDVQFLFKASTLGAQSHGNTPQNAFELNAFGESLFPDIKYRDEWYGLFHKYWVLTTRAHNAVLVNGRGQYVAPWDNPGTPAEITRYGAGPVRNALAAGSILDAVLTPTVDYVVGDAAPAYRDQLRRFQRHVVFVKPDLIVMYDDLDAIKPAAFQWMLHAFGPMEIDAEKSGVHLERTKAGVDLRYLSPAQLVLKQWDGYPMRPKITGSTPNGVPNQWHVEAGTQEHVAGMQMLTVIVPYRKGARTEWKAERLESSSAIGIRFQRNGKSITVAFRKEGITGDAVLGGTRFTGRFAVRRTD